MKSCQQAVKTARENIKANKDPTDGATHFNSRHGGSQADFQGYPIKTGVGPLENSFPTKALPASEIYANTYQ